MKLKYLLFLLPIAFIKNPFSLGNVLEKPSFLHILGTDNLGRDIYTRLLLGTLNTLIIVILSIVLASIIGNIIGFFSAYYGKLVDNIIQTIIEAILSIPSILIAISVVVIIGSGYKAIIISIILMYLPLITQYSRGLMLNEKNKEYVIVAKTYGVKDMRIIFKHIYPNIREYIFLNLVINFSKAILTEAGLGFLGIGIDPSIPTLGNMLNSSQTYFFIAPLFTLAPTISILFLVYYANKLSRKIGNKNVKKIRN